MLFNSIISINIMAKINLKNKYFSFLGICLLMGLPFYLLGLFSQQFQDEKILSQFIFFDCPVFKFFNIACPTCGLGRSFLSLFLWHWKDSWNYHPGGIIIYFSFIGVVFYYFFFPISFNKIQKQLKNWYRLRRKVTTAIFICLYFLWGLLRAPI